MSPTEGQMKAHSSMKSTPQMTHTAIQKISVATALKWRRHDAHATLGVPLQGVTSRVASPESSEHLSASRSACEVADASWVSKCSSSIPGVRPVNIHTSNNNIQIKSTVSATSLPRLDLHEPRPRSGTHTVVIASTPVEELERRSRANSITISGPPRANQRSQSRRRERKYPPVSFPKSFGDHLSSTAQVVAAKPSPSEPIIPKSRGKQTSSPLFAKAVAKDHKDDSSDANKQITPSNKNGLSAFYTTVHYYTECPHASPPATRPLDPDAQPRQASKYDPFHSDITRSLIPGRCFTCDTSYRRQLEDTIIEQCTEQIAELNEVLAGVRKQIECTRNDGMETLSNDRHSAASQRYSQSDEHVPGPGNLVGMSQMGPNSDDIAMAGTTLPRCQNPGRVSRQTRLITRIRYVEAAIDDIQHGQDDFVKAVWHGFTRRWGPATLGVQRDSRANNGSRIEKEIDRLEDDKPQRGHLVTVRDGDDHENRELCTASSRQSRSMDRHASRSRARERKRSKHSHRDVSGSRSPGEGRMKVGWIR